FLNSDFPTAGIGCLRITLPQYLPSTTTALVRPHRPDPLRLELEQPLKDVEQLERPSRRHLVDVEVDPPPPAGSVLDQALCVDVLKPAMDVDPAAVAAVVLEVELVGFLPDGVDPAAEGAAPTGAAQGGGRPQLPLPPGRPPRRVNPTSQSSGQAGRQPDYGEASASRRTRAQQSDTVPSAQQAGSLLVGRGAQSWAAGSGAEPRPAVLSLQHARRRPSPPLLVVADCVGSTAVVHVAIRIALPLDLERSWAAGGSRKRGSIEWTDLALACHVLPSARDRRGPARPAARAEEAAAPAVPAHFRMLGQERLRAVPLGPEPPKASRGVLVRGRARRPARRRHGAGGRRGGGGDLRRAAAGGVDRRRRPAGPEELGGVEGRALRLLRRRARPPRALVLDMLQVG
ncbi:hypothetical protein THAOC_30786, partial [Thalassiosira oceanica]